MKPLEVISGEKLKRLCRPCWLAAAPLREFPDWTKRD